MFGPDIFNSNALFQSLIFDKTLELGERPRVKVTI